MSAAAPLVTAAMLALGAAQTAQAQGLPAGPAAAAGQLMLPFHSFSAPLCGEPLRYGACPHPGLRNTEAFGIDAAGTLVGWYFDQNGTHGFIFAQGVFSALNVPGATTTYAFGISANGRQIVGYDTDPAGHEHGFRLDAAGYTALDVPGATDTRAVGVNDAGQIVGFHADPQGRHHGFLYTGGAFTPLDVPDAIATEAAGINNAGQIVGSYQDGNQRWHGFLYAGGAFTALDYPGGTNTAPFKINDSGQVAGPYQDSNQQWHGFLYSGGTFTPLDAPGGTDTRVYAINNAGQIAGVFQTTDTTTNNQVYLGIYTGVAGWPQQGQIPPALVNTWDWLWEKQIGWPGDPGAYRQTASYRLILGADGRYEFFKNVAKEYNSGELCPTGTGMPQGEREQEHDVGTFVVQDKVLILTVRQGVYSRQDNCNPASNVQGSTGGQVTRLGWQVGLSPQDQLLGLYDYAGGFFFLNMKFIFFSPKQPIAAANLSPQR